MSQRVFLKAVVAIWLTNGQRAVDGANDTRYLVSSDWSEAQRATEDLVSDAYLAWADEAEAERHEREGGTYSDVVPTAKGIFEALS